MCRHSYSPSLTSPESLVVIDKVDVVRSVLPAKADSPLVVDANTVLRILCLESR